MDEYLALMMFPALLVALFLGFPVAFSMMGVALIYNKYPMPPPPLAFQGLSWRWTVLGTPTLPTPLWLVR